MSTITTVTINNRDLPYTIDTYQMYNGDSTEEQEIEWTLEQYPELEKLLPENGGNLEIVFDYDHPAIVKRLAGESIALIEQALQHETPKVIHAIRLVKSRSPNFYNYTTDSYDAEYDIDVAELEKLTPADWRKQVEANGWGEYELQEATDGVTNQLIAKLDLYLRNILPVESYEMDMFEAESRCYYENMKYDAETQAAIDKVEQERQRVKGGK